MLSGWMVCGLSERAAYIEKKRPRYSRGDKYCGVCEKAFRNYEGYECPYCGRRLRE